MRVCIIILNTQVFSILILMCNRFNVAVNLFITNHC